MGILSGIIHNIPQNVGPYQQASSKNLAKELAQKRLLQELRARDREVRAHERAHLLAAGPYARAMSLKTVKGPDGRQYAVAGEVKIDTSPVPNDPQKTLEKARRIKRAALAPLHPSAQDLRVAAKADQMAQKALMEIVKQRLENRETSLGKNNPYHQEAGKLTGKKIDLKV